MRKGTWLACPTIVEPLGIPGVTSGCVTNVLPHPAMDMPFWVHDSQMEGSGFFSSIGKAFKNVYS
eukprot:COSAG01_NODE_12092_length_1802_cov_72.655901_5_plen_64_part_01